MDWVVTYRIARSDTNEWGMAEFYRGSEAECRRIQKAFAGGECDIVPTNPWQVLIGPVDDWLDFISQEGIST
jgi:hypothetical protein